MNQKGFTAFEAVLVIVTLLAIGVAGYFAYQAHQTKKVSPVKTSTTSPAIKVPTKTTTAPAPNYLAISQLGLKFQTTGLTNLTYSYSKGAENSDPNVFLSTVTFTSSDLQGCFDGGSNSGALGWMVQSTKPEDGAIQVGQYYYFHTGPQSACVSDALTAKQQTDIKILINDLKTLQSE
ncbi:MAG TPA: hypothetical protein VMR75_01450 [Candidatus Saccharimonadales bacterium]|nr:hypothetical protein [Candidatus Saccharimonadales bacterium]